MQSPWVVDPLLDSSWLQYNFLQTVFFLKTNIIDSIVWAVVKQEVEKNTSWLVLVCGWCNVYNGLSGCGR